MKKTIFSSFLFIIFILFVGLSYLSFFGYETNRFNYVIKKEVQKSNNNLKINFEKISILLDLKKLTLYVKFFNPNLNYLGISIPLESLRTDIDLESLINKKLSIKKIFLSTEKLNFDEVRPLLKQSQVNTKLFKNIKGGRLQIKNLKLEFDNNQKLKENFEINGHIDNLDIKFSKDYEIENLASNFSYKKNNLNLNKMFCKFKGSEDKKIVLYDGELLFKQGNKKNDVDIVLKSNELSSLPKIPIINYSFLKDSTALINIKFSIDKKNKIFFKEIVVKDSENKFRIKNLILSKNYSFINLSEINVKTSLNNKVNNEFKVIYNDKIYIQGKIFDAKMLVKALTKDTKKNNFLSKVSKEIEIDFQRILKGAKFPIKNFRLIGKIEKGFFEKITAKSDFSKNEHLDISLKRIKKTSDKVLEIYSDIATPLLSDYKFFQGLEGGNLIYFSEFNKNISLNTLTINNFKLNDAPALAKLLTLADLKGLTDSLKGEGISFDTLSIAYKTNPSTMTISEIFMIGPSISVLIDGYVEKKTGLISLRGTLVPAKTLNAIVSKIPVIGEILVGDKVGEGVFGLSFKIKGLPDDLKTTVNPVKTIAPRFITRAVEEAKKRNSK